MNMTIKDVARVAGVSPSTVSRVVNGNETSAASAETQKKIWAAVRELCYTPNQNARSLKRSQSTSHSSSKEIACFHARMIDAHLDPFFSILMNAAEHAIFDLGYILRYQYSAANLQSAGWQALDPSVESLLVLGRPDASTLNVLQAQYRHIVYVGLQNLPFDIDQVVSRGCRATENSVHYLYNLGHRRICYMGETANEQRFQGYLRAVRDLNLNLPDDYVIETMFTPTGGYDATQKLLAQGLDFAAILCANDMTAIGALKALKEHRFKVPQDVSLIGVNDMETVRYLSPMLTSNHIPIEEMGHAAAKLLIDRIEGGHKQPVKLFFPSQLICRESCAPPKK